MEFISLCLVIVVVGFISWAFFLVADSAGLPIAASTTTTVKTRWENAGHFQTTHIQSGETTMPVMTYHPASFHVAFLIDGNEHSLSVESETFDALQPGDEIIVEYGYGRLTGRIRARSLRKSVP